MELIATPYKLEDIERLKNAGADAVVIANPFYSARGAAYFQRKDMGSLRLRTRQLHMKMYVLVNRFFMEDELTSLRAHLAYLKELDVDGIYYGDEGVLYEAKKLQLTAKLIYHPDTLITNKEDVQYYLDEGIKMVTISKDITLKEICEIARHVKGECEVIIHGRLNMMHSKRTLLTNYMTFIGKQESLKKKQDLYIMEENRDEKMPILEDDLGTHVFTGYTLVSFEEVLELQQSGILHMRIDGIFHDIDYL